MIKEGKKGQGHVEAIFSFIIFLGFMIFLLYFFNPFKISSNTTNYLDIAERNILNSISLTIDVLPIKLNESINDCFYFNSSINSLNKNISVFDIDGNKVKAYHDGEKIYIKGNNKDFYYIYFSNYINETPIVGRCNEFDNYTLGLYRSYDVISFKLLKEFEKKYKNDYVNLKKEIGLPTSKNFAIVFYDNSIPSQIILSIGKIPEKTTVYSRTTPVKIIYGDGVLNYSLMNIRLW